MTAGRDAPELQALSLKVPPDLRIASRRGVKVTAASGKPVGLRFTDHASPTTLTITLRRRPASLRVTLGPPSLAARRGRVAATVLPGGARLKLTLNVTDANSGRSELTANVDGAIVTLLTGSSSADIDAPIERCWAVVAGRRRLTAVAGRARTRRCGGT